MKALCIYLAAAVQMIMRAAAAGALLQKQQVKQVRGTHIAAFFYKERAMYEVGDEPAAAVLLRRAAAARASRRKQQNASLGWYVLCLLKAVVHDSAQEKA
jgi:hypothetical protein